MEEEWFQIGCETRSQDVEKVKFPEFIALLRKPGFQITAKSLL